MHEGVDQHFVVQKLVALGELHDAVQHEDTSKEGVIEDFDALVLRFFSMEVSNTVVAVDDGGEWVGFGEPGGVIHGWCQVRTTLGTVVPLNVDA